MDALFDYLPFRPLYIEDKCCGGQKDVCLTNLEDGSVVSLLSHSFSVVIFMDITTWITITKINFFVS